MLLTGCIVPSRITLPKIDDVADLKRILVEIFKKANGEWESAHQLADLALLAYINDPEVTKRYTQIAKKDPWRGT